MAYAAFMLALSCRILTEVRGMSLTGHDRYCTENSKCQLAARRRAEKSIRSGDFSEPEPSHRFGFFGSWQNHASQLPSSSHMANIFVIINIRPRMGLPPRSRCNVLPMLLTKGRQRRFCQLPCMLCTYKKEKGLYTPST